MKKYFLLSISLSFFTLFSCTSKREKMENQAQLFIAKIEKELKPLYKEVGIASWNASISGTAEDYKRSEDAQVNYMKLFSNKDLFNELKTIKESGQVKDSVLNREIEILYFAFLRNQVSKELLEKKIKMELELEKKYSNFRAEVNGKKITDNEIEDILASSTSSAEVEKAWKAHKVIGREVAADIVAVVKVRNQIAKELGFDNYHTMNMVTSEQDPKQVLALFDELDTLTRGAFVSVKTDIDNYLSNRFSISKDKLMPWHYQNRFFQEAPKIYKVDLDKFFTDKDIVVLTSQFYKGINLDVENIIKQSDLYEKPGKNQHAYCTDIDHNGDVRVLCNIKNNMYWMNTLLHEYGHGVYALYNDPQKPFLLRDAAHSFTTEAIAMLMDRLASNPQWLLDMGIISADQKEQVGNDTRSSLRLSELTFSRWAQVMYRFEKELYANPDQDLNQLWWNLVEKYQLIKKPEGRNEPDWASKIHVALYPCYYHNYIMGGLLSSQLFYYISDSVLKNKDYRSVSFVNKPEVGKYLKEKVFMPGMLYKWEDMIEKATGEKLTAKYFAKEFVEN